MTNSRFNFVFSTICTMVLLVLLSSRSARADSHAAQQAKKHFLAARSEFENDRSNFEAAWKFGQACFDWAEFAENNSQREEIAHQGIEACKQVILRQPKAVEGHYYLGMNFGQLARTKTLGAIKLVDEMEKEFKLTREIDENFDFAGSDRNLGLLYLQAPGWPTSIGSRSKARQHLEHAAKLTPSYLENRLNLIDAYLKWGDKNGAQREFDSIKKIWPTAKKEFTGEKWDDSWTDWEKRLEKLQAQFAESSKSRESARGKK